MPTKIGQAIQEAVQTEVKNAIIASPRFSDYRVFDFIDTGAFEGIDTELDELLAKIETKSDTKQRKKLEAIKLEMSDLKRSMSTIQSTVNDPQGVLFDQVGKILERFPIAKLALKLLPLVGIALQTPAVIDKIVDTLTQPGGPFDKRLRIILEKQEEQFLSRLEQKRRQIGSSQVVISLFDGFGNANGRMTTNTLAQVKATGTSNIGLNEIQIGLTR